MIDSLMARSRARNILKLLHEERKIILEGPLSDLNRLAARRDTVVEYLSAGKIALKHSDIETIRQEASRNQNLLSASISGIQEAKSLLAEQHRDTSTMGTYTDTGKRLEPTEITNVKDRIV